MNTTDDFPIDAFMAQARAMLTMARRMMHRSADFDRYTQCINSLEEMIKQDDVLKEANKEIEKRIAEAGDPTDDEIQAIIDDVHTNWP
jgi:hypothetical protein